MSEKAAVKRGDHRPIESETRRSKEGSDGPTDQKTPSEKSEALRLGVRCGARTGLCAFLRAGVPRFSRVPGPHRGRLLAKPPAFRRFNEPGRQQNLTGTVLFCLRRGPSDAIHSSATTNLAELVVLDSDPPWTFFIASSEYLCKARLHACALSNDSTNPHVAKGAASSGLRSDAIGGIIKYQPTRASAAAWRSFMAAM